MQKNKTPKKIVKKSPKRVMKKQSKSSTIINAWTGDLPVGERFYRDRLTLCRQCPELSTNKEDLSLLDKGKEVLLGPYCTICGCPVAKKAAMKEEQCPLSPPRWPALAVLTASAEDWNVYNNSPHIASLDLASSGTAYELDYGLIHSTTPSILQLVFEGQYEITGVSSGCGCTTPSFEKLGNGIFHVTLGVDPTKIHVGNFEKLVTVQFKTGEELVEVPQGKRMRDVIRNVTIKLKGQKK